jgi:hypothetical protein
MADFQNILDGGLHTGHGHNKQQSVFEVQWVVEAKQSLPQILNTNT